MPFFIQDDDPPYVDEGVAKVEALLDASNMDAMDDAVLLWLLGLLGVCVLGRFKYASRRRAAFGRLSIKSSYRASPHD